MLRTITKTGTTRLRIGKDPYNWPQAKQLSITLSLLLLIQTVWRELDQSDWSNAK